MALRIVTWNVNSIRVRLEGLNAMIAALAPDVVCLQETKVMDAQFPMAAVKDAGFDHIFINGAKGYGGVAILSKLPFAETGKRAWCQRTDGRHAFATVDAGGRLGEVEIHSMYVPAGGDIPDPEINDKFAHKLAFLDEMRDWSETLGNGGRKVVLSGDLNVAPLETDVWSHRQLLKVVSHTPIEVEHLNRAAAAGGWIDAVRHFVPETQRLYSWWSYRSRDWKASDRGRRLDHLWVSPPLHSHLGSAKILKEARDWPRPSDHVPVLLELAD